MFASKAKNQWFLKNFQAKQPKGASGVRIFSNNLILAFEVIMQSYRSCIFGVTSLKVMRLRVTGLC